MSIDGVFQWFFEERDDGYAIRCKDRDRYLNVDGGVADGHRLIAEPTEVPLIWTITYHGDQSAYKYGS